MSRTNKYYIKGVKSVVLLTVLLSLLAGAVPEAVFAQRRTHTVFYEGRENELNVYRIHGVEPGKTLMIVGGIQGDEPAGFLAADLYADFSLEKGNLIVVPRANFPSILRKERKINKDMNRKFLDQGDSYYETQVVHVLKDLIRESDCLLNLHEGSGVFSKKWEGPMRNPRRYGQSVIADAAVYTDEDTGVIIDLGTMAEKVIEKINRHIKDPDYKFTFNNHRTANPDSVHKEQRGSATYYALYECNVPAFGIESAKSLPLEQKVKQHIHAVNGFMDILDIVPETPGIDLKKPELQYMVISVNDSVPVVVGEMQHLKIRRGDRVEVLDIVANYRRGLSADIIGKGNGLNDMNQTFTIREDTRIEAKKDFYSCGSVFLDVCDLPDRKEERLTVSESEKTDTLKYRLLINGERHIFGNYSHVKVERGDVLVIQDIITGRIDPADCVVNFKGFVGNRRNNDGEDRGYEIDTGEDVLMKRYSIEKKGKRYYILTTLQGKEVGKLFIHFQS
ncbi:MAG: M14/M99 family metallopeptidase [Desulfobacteraceae bacterium]